MMTNEEEMQVMSYCEENKVGYKQRLKSSAFPATKTTGLPFANSCPTGGRSNPNSTSLKQLGPTWPSRLRLEIE